MLNPSKHKIIFFRIRIIY